MLNNYQYQTIVLKIIRQQETKDLIKIARFLFKRNDTETNCYLIAVLSEIETRLKLKKIKSII